MQDFTHLIREARTEEERIAIYRFRYRVYVEEMGKPYNADHTNRLLADELDDTATLLYFESEGEIHGTVRINWGKDESSYAAFNTLNFALFRFDRVARKAFSFTSRLMISPQYRKSRLGLDLARRSYKLALQNCIRLNFISCKPELVKYFERLGFKQYQIPFRDKTAGEQFPMVFFLEDIGHLREIKSPFLERDQHENNRGQANKLEVPVFV